MMAFFSFSCGLNKIWNRTRPGAFTQNQHTRELISTQNKHNTRSLLLRLFRVLINSLVSCLWSYQLFDFFSVIIFLSVNNYVQLIPLDFASVIKLPSSFIMSRMYLWWSVCTLYLHIHQVRVTIGNSGLCCCACVTPFEHWLTPLCVVPSSLSLMGPSLCICLCWFSLSR